MLTGCSSMVQRLVTASFLSRWLVFLRKSTSLQSKCELFLAFYEYNNIQNKVLAVMMTRFGFDTDTVACVHAPY